MNLSELRSAGGFISPEPQRVSIEWRARRFDVFVKRLSFGDVEAMLSGQDDRSRSATMIAASILLGEGREPISYDDAYRLEVSLATKLIEAINSANGTPSGVGLPN